MYLVISEGQWTEHIIGRFEDSYTANLALEREKKKENWLHLYVAKVENKVTYGML